MMNSDTEIRKLAIGELNTLARHLSPDAWKILMANIKIPDSTSIPRFTSEDVRLVEEAGKNQQRPAAEVFLSEWCTMGKTKPTVASMIELLIETNLLRAADYLAVDVLKGDPVERPLEGPAAPIDISRLLEESTPPDSDNETNGERETFWDDPTVRVDLERLENIGVIEIGFVEEKINNDCFSINLQAVSSDLIKFSKSVEQIQEERSDLIKFSSDVIADEESRGNNAVEEPYLIPSFSLLGLKTTEKSDNISNSSYTETTSSVDSTEESMTRTNSVQSDDDTRTNSVQSDDETRTDLMQSDDFNLPAMSQILPDDLKTESGGIEIDPSGDVEDVPVPVLEFFKR